MHRLASKGFAPSHFSESVLNGHSPQILEWKSSINGVCAMRFLSSFCVWIVTTGQLVAQVSSNSIDGRQGASPGVPARTQVQAQTEERSETGPTLRQLIDEAIKANPGLQSAHSRSAVAKARIPQARAWDDPFLGIEFFATPITSINPFIDGMETDYFLQQMFPFPGKKGLMGDAAEASAKMSEQSAFVVERDLIVNVKRSYAMLYSAQHRVGVNDQNQRLINQIIASARSKYSVGNGNQSDVLKAQIELARLQNERSTLDQEVTSAVAMLNALRGEDKVLPIGRLADFKVIKPSIPLDSLMIRSLGVRPELLTMKYELQMNQLEIAASKRELFPDFMVKGTYKQMMGQTDQWAAMIGINLPIAPWGIGKYSGKIEENEANSRATEESLTEMRNMVRAQVSNAYAIVASRWQQVDRYQQTILPQTGQALDATLTAYTNDKTDFLSLLDSYRMLQMFRMEYYMALENYVSSTAALERAVGMDLQ